MKQTRIITEGALLLALTMVLAFLAVYIPIAGMLFLYLLALPLTIYTYRYGVKPGALFLVGSAIVSFIIGSIYFLLPVLTFTLCGLVIGELTRRKRTAIEVLIGGTLSFLFMLLLNYIFIVTVLDFDFMKETTKWFDEAVQQSEGMLQFSDEELANQTKLFEEMVRFLPKIVPSVLVFTAVISTFIVQLLAKKILKRLGFEATSFPPFSEWLFPKVLLWYYLIVSLIFYIGVSEGMWELAVLNLFIVLEVIMTVQGLSFIFFFTKWKGLSKAVPIVVTIFAFIVPFLLYLIRILGIIDLGFDLRQRLQERK
ncbi:YybS family protein [Bacillus tianshenii]|nr:YybS family protein [Bacillus tianshenii]